MFLLIHLLLIVSYQEVASSPALGINPLNPNFLASLPSIQISIQERASEAWPYEMCNQPINANVSQSRNGGRNNFFIL